jgi:hypothetical protein
MRRFAPPAPILSCSTLRLTTSALAVSPKGALIATVLASLLSASSAQKPANITSIVNTGTVETQATIAPQAENTQQQDTHAVSADNTGRTLSSMNVLGSAGTGGWQYCLATSNVDEKVYVSAPFPRIADLDLAQLAFADRLRDLQHDVVQCPISSWRGTVATMRADAIAFSRKTGKSVVDLAWQPFAISHDEDPIDATIYTGGGSIGIAHSEWHYCYARSEAENRIYITTAFASQSSLHTTETAFAQKLAKADVQPNAVQCPIGNDEASILTMREHLIRFSDELGRTIVSLSSEL